MGTKGWTALLLCWLMVACCSCGSDNDVSSAPGESKSPVMSDGGVYLRYNLHYIAEKGVNKASFANWTDWPGHAFLSYNSKVRTSSFGSRITFTAQDTEAKIVMEYNAKRMEMSPKAYIELITSPTPVSYSDLSAVDQAGIQAGEARLGMTKQGVMIALGYPAKHRTPSTDLNTWLYWKGRMTMLTVNFGQDGKVESLQ